MQIFIKTSVSGTIALEVSSTDTVEEVKRKLRFYGNEGFVPEADRLVFVGKTLDGARTLADCGVQKEDTLHLTLPLRGGRDPNVCDGYSTYFSTLNVGFSEECVLERRASEKDLAELSMSRSQYLEDAYECCPGPATRDSEPILDGALISEVDVDEWLIAHDSDSASPTASSISEAAPDVEAQCEVYYDLYSRSQSQVLQQAVHSHELTPTENGPTKALSGPVTKGQKGLAYDLSQVDDKLRRRLLKNRQSAERSRLKKVMQTKELEEMLAACRAENAALKEQNARLLQQLAERPIQT